ncbi:MAG TPA: ATP-binding protein [Mycobacterium sp.]
MNIPRQRHVALVRRALRTNRVVAILGARQVGKTTLAREVAGNAGSTTWFDLEDSRDRAQLSDPMLALRHRTGLVVLDEVQRLPDIFEPLRVLADRPRGARFLLLGGASPDLLRQSSETLAGRIVYLRLPGLALDEIGAEQWPRLWLRGGFPRSYVANTQKGSGDWRRDFVRTFLERDLAQVALGVPPATLERFWVMLAHCHGRVFNASELGRSLGVTDKPVRRYLDLLAGTFVVRVLRPWHENLAKRQVRQPKVYIDDSGLLHTLLDIDRIHDLERHPKVGASWEGFALEQVVARVGARDGECYFWSTHQGAELDLLIVRGSRRRGYEFKRADAPTMTRSMHIAMTDLRLDSLDVIYPGQQTYPLGDRARAVGISRLWADLRPLR